MRKAKTPEKKAKEKLWSLARAIIRLKYGNRCYTCYKEPLEGSGWHVGHFIASSVCGANLRYDLRNLRPQCYRCNINLSGNGAVFYRHMVIEEGQEYVDRLFRDKEISVKADILFYNNLIKKYESILKELEDVQ